MKTNYMNIKWAYTHTLFKLLFIINISSDYIIILLTSCIQINNCLINKCHGNQ